MSKKLLAWEEHTRQNTIDGQPFGGMITYWRRCDENGKEIIYLSPEGVKPSQCWAWMFCDFGSRLCGSCDDFECAKMGADEVAQRLGYEVEIKVGVFSKIRNVLEELLEFRF